MREFSRFCVKTKSPLDVLSQTLLVLALAGASAAVGFSRTGLEACSLITRKYKNYKEMVVRCLTDKETADRSIVASSRILRSPQEAGVAEFPQASREPHLRAGFNEATEMVRSGSSDRHEGSSEDAAGLRRFKELHI